MAAFEGTREGLALEAVEARGERQVRRGRGLRLEPGDPLDGAGRGEGLSLEQELAREERPLSSRLVRMRLLSSASVSGRGC